MNLKTLLVASSVLVAGPALACPPYVETCHQDRVDEHMRAVITARGCLNDHVCLGGLVVARNDKVYHVTKSGKGAYAVTARKARKMIKDERAYIVFEGDKIWRETSIRYLVAATGK